MSQRLDNRGQLRVAPLKNVQLMMQVAHRVCDAPDHLTNWACAYAPPGYGKTTAIYMVQKKREAIVIEARVTWTQAAVIEALENELSIAPTKQAVYKRENKVIEVLSAQPLPLIFDEANHLCKKKVIELIREISFISHCPVILVGTETLKQELQEYPVAASRVLEWLPLNPCTFEDAQALAKLYANGISISDELLRHFVQTTKGVTRQVVANIDKARNLAANTGTMLIDRKAFEGATEVFSGAPADTWLATMKKRGLAA
jgi:replication-associated recombination protein RarA